MMSITVQVCNTFGLFVLEKKTDTMCMLVPHVPSPKMKVDAAGQGYKQTGSLVFLGGSISETPHPMTEITEQKPTAWIRAKR